MNGGLQAVLAFKWESNVHGTEPIFHDAGARIAAGEKDGVPFGPWETLQMAATGAIL